MWRAFHSCPFVTSESCCSLNRKGDKCPGAAERHKFLLEPWRHSSLLAGGYLLGRGQTCMPRPAQALSPWEIYKTHKAIWFRFQITETAFHCFIGSKKSHEMEQELATTTCRRFQRREKNKQKSWRKRTGHFSSLSADFSSFSIRSHSKLSLHLDGL